MHLSKREHQCLTWAAHGKTYAEIGAILDLSFGSVKSYLDAARYKLHGANIVHTVAIAVKTGVIDIEDAPRYPAIDHPSCREPA
jgi:DNA-binding CsgD family transcriptional regulator